MTYEEARMYLKQISLSGSKLRLNSLIYLLEQLGNPQEELRYVHIAGTNGKGSVLAYTSSILTAGGYKTGCYISPAVLSELEKIQVDGRWITEAEFAKLTSQIREAVTAMQRKGIEIPTIFEIETAMAFLHFKAHKCDVVVLETGLGGDMDATNVVRRTLVTAFVSITRDHTEYLGNTMREIAEKKAGIMKPGCIAVTQRQMEEVQMVLEGAARKKDIPLITAESGDLAIVEESYRGQKIKVIHSGLLFDIPMAGAHQAENAQLACMIIEQLITFGFHISDETICRGMKAVYWPGRFQCVMEKPVFIVDGAHNLDAVKRLKETMQKYFAGKTMRFIIGIFKDKEYEQILSEMAPTADKIYAVNLPSAERTLRAEELCRCASRYCEDVVYCSNLKEAVTLAVTESAETDVILAFGSLSYIGEIINGNWERSLNARSQ